MVVDVSVSDGRVSYRLRFFDLSMEIAICLEADGNTGVYRTTDSANTGNSGTASTR
jgi:hypothetical protein